MIKSVEASKSSNCAIILKPVINPETGKISPRKTAFNEYKWGDVTRNYMELVLNLSDMTYTSIIDEAKALAMAT